MQRKCKQCEGPYETTDKRRKFCSPPCYWAWSKTHSNPGRFKSGIVPWNTGTKGVMKPNSGSFKKGRDNGMRMAAGSVAIRRDKQGRQRAWIKVHDTRQPSDWILRAVVRWGKHRGAVPKGCLVHHKDRNTLNDRIANLQLMTRAQHLMEHRPEFEHKRRGKAAAAARKRHATNRAKRGAVQKTA